MTDIDEMPPKEIIDAAMLVGRYFAERNIKTWMLGPCASRVAYEEAVSNGTLVSLPIKGAPPA